MSRGTEYGIRLTFFTVIALMGAGGAPVFAQTPQDWAHCLGGDLSTPDVPIEGCTAVINTGREVLRRLATAYNNRGVAYRAVDDYDQAIRIKPDYVAAFYNRGLALADKGEFRKASPILQLYCVLIRKM